ncbi:MAG: ABC-ATPase domain-containing protein [Magnetococcales bacterium]|nr:ABC-ATPase domain-containing protein [Magnetococcales bacterium]
MKIQPAETKYSIPTMESLETILNGLDGGMYDSYKELLGRKFQHPNFSLEILHIQGNPGAYPASVCCIVIKKNWLEIADEAISTPTRKMATADFLVRALGIIIIEQTQHHRGSQGSGTFQNITLPQQVLQRNIVEFTQGQVRINFRISLPGSFRNKIMGKEAAEMFITELPKIVLQLREGIREREKLKLHWQTVEDAEYLREKLPEMGLVGFIADGSILPRKSGISDLPMDSNLAGVFVSPEELAAKVFLPNAGEIRGMGIKQGVTCVIGGAYHGKSTLLLAIARGVYPHIPGDGREVVVTINTALMVRSEQGRVVRGTNISAFINNLPDGHKSSSFFTDNASGSTSQAAAIVEAVQSGSKLLLIDDDSSASNLLNRDSNMRQLIPKDPITPLFDRIEELHEKHKVSLMIIAGSSSDFLGVADSVIGMHNYRPEGMTKSVKKLTLTKPVKPTTPLNITDQRILADDNFDPSYFIKRQNKTIPARIKPLRKRPWVLEYGNNDINLSQPAALVDPDQTLAIGQALFTAHKIAFAGKIEDLIESLLLIDMDGWNSTGCPLFLAQPRPLEIIAAINRLRSLRLSN